MELKLINGVGSLAGTASLNCTFMELKSALAGEQSVGGNVLIVPLWN